MKKLRLFLFSFLFSLSACAQKSSLNEIYSKLERKLIQVNENKLETINLKIDLINLILNKIYENRNYKIYHYQKLNGSFEDSLSFFDREIYFFIYCKKLKKGILFTAKNCCFYENYKNLNSYSFRSDCSSLYLTNNIFYLCDIDNNTYNKLKIDTYVKINYVNDPMTTIHVFRENEIIKIFSLDKNYADIFIEDLINLVETN